MEATARTLGRNRPFLTLLLVAFLMHVASYLVIPVLPVYLGTVEGFAVSQVGWILGIGSVAYQTGSLGGGFVADRWGRRNLMAAGALLEGAAMTGYFFSRSFGAFAFFALVNGIGVGLLAPALKAKIADVVEEGERTRAFSWRGILANAGIIAAGLAITVLALSTDRRVFLYSAVGYALLAVVAFRGLRRDRCVGENCRPLPLREYRNILSHRHFLLFSAVSLLIWALYAQFALVMPLRAAYVLGGAARIGLIWTINSVSVVLLQGLLSRFVLERLNPYISLIAGTLLIGGGLFFLGRAHTFAELSASAVTFVLGEMLLLPVLDTLIGHFAREEWLGAYFGISNVVAGIGSALGNSLGGVLIERLGGVKSPSPWIAYGWLTLFIVSILSLFAFYAVRGGRTNPRSPAPYMWRKEKAR